MKILIFVVTLLSVAELFSQTGSEISDFKKDSLKILELADKLEDKNLRSTASEVWAKSYLLGHYFNEAGKPGHKLKAFKVDGLQRLIRSQDEYQKFFLNADGAISEEDGSILGKALKNRNVRLNKSLSEWVDGTKGFIVVPLGTPIVVPKKPKTTPKGDENLQFLWKKIEGEGGDQRWKLEAKVKVSDGFVPIDLEKTFKVSK